MGSDEKFPKKERLAKTASYRKVYRNGRSFSDGQFVLKVLPTALCSNRMGFSISSACIKSSSRRNRIRRLFREAFRKNKSALKEAFDMVVVVKKEPAANISYNETKKAFLKLAGKAGILV